MQVIELKPSMSVVKVLESVYLFQYDRGKDKVWDFYTPSDEGLKPIEIDIENSEKIWIYRDIYYHYDIEYSQKEILFLNALKNEKSI